MIGGRWAVVPMIRMLPCLASRKGSWTCDGRVLDQLTTLSFSEQPGSVTPLAPSLSPKFQRWGMGSLLETEECSPFQRPLGEFNGGGSGGWCWMRIRRTEEPRPVGGRRSALKESRGVGGKDDCCPLD